MRKDTKEAGELTIGIDLGDRKSHYHILSRHGKTLEEGLLPMAPAKAEIFFAQFGPSRVVMEVGCQSNWVTRVAKGQGHEVLVADTRKLELITRSNYKTDQKDAGLLAKLAYTTPEWLHPVHQLSETAQEHMVLYEVRKAFIAQRTTLVNLVRGKLKEFGIHLPKSLTNRRSIDKAKDLVPAGLQAALIPALEQIQLCTEQEREYKKMLEDLAQEAYPEAQRLRQICGVGPLTSFYFLLRIGDPARFKRSRDVGAYLGMVPKRRQSGKQDPKLGITKTGDPELRCLLIQCAQYIMGHFGKDCDLRRFGERLMARGSKKRILVAVARKLACLMHHLWMHQVDYDPDYQLKRQAAA